jgi:predicted ATP-dependent Lon-type protease
MDRSTTLDWLESTIYYSIGLNLQSTTLDCLESMPLHSDTLSWFEANQSLLLHLNVACLAEKQQTPILSNWLESTIYYTRLAWIHDLLHSIGLNPRSTTQLAWIHNLLHSIGLNPRSTTLDWLESMIYYTRLAWIHDLLHSIGLNPRSTVMSSLAIFLLKT